MSFFYEFIFPGSVDSQEITLYTSTQLNTTEEQQMAKIRVATKLYTIVTSTLGFIGNKVHNDKHKDGSRRLKIEAPFLISEEEKKEYH